MQIQPIKMHGVQFSSAEKANSFIRKEETSQVNDVSFYFKKAGMMNKLNPK